MKTMHKVNIWIYGITLFLYVTVIFGMLMQILLGIVQVMMAIILISKFNEFTKEIKLHLSIYVSITTLYLIFFFSSDSMGMMGFDYTVPLLMILPMSIGAYFVYITYQVKKQFENKTSITYEDDEILA